ncbi:NAD(P)H-dependent oxidoreductase [Spirochaeta isovalerica]|uniref:Multimeric flavodoxin WrbA n=1 Tax=Spirochaeta isovalerica TaxID=150 RepID=A0A841R6F2_9SPIO|nr:NAD(P)H-dependent oxidoreductase [Spirochaeta isovalerica]MBB6479416.1 multimeric flavodoxin WrbA [Spirochaeta isovalerica]
MRITLVNGIQKGPEWENHRQSLSGLYNEMKQNHSVDYFPIADMKMAHCQGCWDCWTKTPGICRLKDDGVDYLKSLINCDLLLFASPVTAGFLTSETKKALDRFIPEALPFIGIYDKECHHLPRYPHKKFVGFILLDQGDIEGKARELIEESIDRNALNMRPRKMLKLNLTNNNAKEIIREINSL